MYNKDYFNGIYNDFFGVEVPKENEVDSDKNKIMLDYFNKINDLYIEEESKNLLKQILEYMRKYDEKIESNYIAFQVLLILDDLDTKKIIADILRDASQAFNYRDTGVKELSLYHISSDINYKDIFDNAGFIHITDLKGLELLNFDSKKRFFYELEKYLNESNKITVISGNKNDTNIFLSERSILKEKYFTFVINGIKPTIQDIYERIISELDIEDSLKVKLLDYISATYKEITDYQSYIYNLEKELAFNKKLPILIKDKSLDEIFIELNELVGLDKVKKALHELVDLMNLKEKNDTLKINNLNLHMVFLGNPGTGKTTVARIVANILYNLKYIKENKLIEVTSKDLVAEYVGQTAPKTNAVIEKALGGVLFIDEAYSLASVNGANSYNGEAIATLIQAMENHRDDLVVIFAGYTKEMQDFLNSNSGIVSRIGYTMEFDDYTEDELVNIFKIFMTKAGFVVKDDALDALREIISLNKDMKNFGNARFVRNIYEKSIIKHASNTKNRKSKEILRTITKEDISTEYLSMK